MWATKYIEQLKQGKTVSFRPTGNSMQGRIESRQLVTVAPLSAPPKAGDIVLCKCGGNQWLHLVSAVGADGRYQISNNKGYVNGWTTLANIFGIVTHIDGVEAPRR